MLEYNSEMREQLLLRTNNWEHLIPSAISTLFRIENDRALGIPLDFKQDYLNSHPEFTRFKDGHAFWENGLLGMTWCENNGRQAREYTAVLVAVVAQSQVQREIERRTKASSGGVTFYPGPLFKIVNGKLYLPDPNQKGAEYSGIYLRVNSVSL